MSAQPTSFPVGAQRLPALLTAISARHMLGLTVQRFAPEPWQSRILVEKAIKDTPDAIRTRYLLLRRQSLYPSELPGQECSHSMQAPARCQPRIGRRSNSHFGSTCGAIAHFERSSCVSRTASWFMWFKMRIAAGGASRGSRLHFGRSPIDLHSQAMVVSPHLTIF